MYKLFWAKGTGSFVVHGLLEWVGAEYERIIIDFENGEQRSPQYLALNPLGEIPTLQLPDGQIMTESAAMVLHIVESYPKAELAPPISSFERAIFYRWLLFMAVNLYPAALQQYNPQRFTTDPASAASIKAKAEERLEQYWDIIGDALEAGSFLVGDRLTAADVYLLMLLEWYERAGDRPILQEFRELVLQQPVIHKVWQENFT